MLWGGGCQGIGRSFHEFIRGWGLCGVIVLMLVSMLVAGSPEDQGKAVQDGSPTRTSAAQVRIFANEEAVGGGTLVAPNWVLTVAHLFYNDDSPEYTLRFGVTTAAADATDAANLRRIDRIVQHPQRADIALAHFADPVPEGTWFPSLAAEPPPRMAWARLYGWGPDMNVLNRVSTVVYDPEAIENAAHLHQVYPVFSVDYSSGAIPMVLNAVTDDGDSGGGVFSPRGVLSGVHWGLAPYHEVNSSGELYGEAYRPAYEQPVWSYRTWIRSVINGEGPSGTGSVPASGGSPGRQLTSSTGSGLPMTMPPQVEVCDEGETSCAIPDPTWASESLMGAGNYRGTASAVCVQGKGNGCSFDGKEYAGGSVARLPLGPKGMPGTAPRRVAVWCRSSNVFAAGTSARPALRVTFTNDEHEEVPIGMGWWDVTPDQVGAGTGQIPVNNDLLSAC